MMSGLDRLVAVAPQKHEAHDITQAILKRENLDCPTTLGLAHGLILSRLLWMALPLSRPEAVGCDLADLEGWILRITVVGADLGKNSCSLVGLDKASRVVPHRRTHCADEADPKLVV